MRNKPKIVIDGSHIDHAKTLSSIQVTEIKEEKEEEIFTIKNYRVSPLIPVSLYVDKPSNNALKRCAKGLHLYNTENECVICNKSINYEKKNYNFYHANSIS